MGRKMPMYWGNLIWALEKLNSGPGPTMYQDLGRLCLLDLLACWAWAWLKVSLEAPEQKS